MRPVQRWRRFSRTEAFAIFILATPPLQVCETLFGSDVYFGYAGSTSASDITYTCNGDVYGQFCKISTGSMRHLFVRG